MLQRLFIDNFRSFQNFEWTPGSLALLIGRNGSGKTAIFDVLYALRGLVCEDEQLNRALPASTCTRWELRDDQRFECDLAGPAGLLKYRLVVRQTRPQGESQVLEETLHLGETPLFSFIDGRIQLHHDSGQPGATFSGNARRSGLGLVVPSPTNIHLTWFKRWFERLVVLRPNPMVIDGRAASEDHHLRPTGVNFASWYRTQWQERPQEVNNALAALAQVVDGFTGLQIRVDERRVGWLRALFLDPTQRNRRTKDLALDFDELSDGQRLLILLYIILHTQIESGRTVILDEPDNYASLDEVQPFLMEAVSRVQDQEGAQLFVISHNPVFIDQLAPDDGFVVWRDNGGPSRVRRFASSEVMSASELILRGDLTQEPQQ